MPGVPGIDSELVSELLVDTVVGIPVAAVPICTVDDTPVDIAAAVVQVLADDTLGSYL